MVESSLGVEYENAEASRGSPDQGEFTEREAVDAVEVHLQHNANGNVKLLPILPRVCAIPSFSPHF